MTKASKATIATIIQTQKGIFLPLADAKQLPQQTRACKLLVVSKFCMQTPLRVELFVHTCTAGLVCKNEKEITKKIAKTSQVRTPELDL